jgi:hypothetical protein
MCPFDGADSGTNSDVLVSFRLDVGTFVERLLVYCCDITTFQIMVQSLGFLRSCALFYHYLSSVAAPAELTGGPLPPDQEFIQLTRYLSLPTTPRHLLNSDFSLALGRHQDH